MQHNTLPAIQEGLRKTEIYELAIKSVDNVLEEGNVFQVAEAIAAKEEFVKAVRKDERYVEFLRDELIKNAPPLVAVAAKAGIKTVYTRQTPFLWKDEAPVWIRRGMKDLQLVPVHVG